MKKIAIIALVGAFLYGCGSSKTLFTADTVAIKASMDLNQVVDDKVWVEVDPGNLAPGPTSFFIPKTVPGTYSSDNYGKYIEGFKAFDSKGNELAFEKTDDNTWVIADGGNLDKVGYYVNDTYDSEGEHAEPVFSPAGTNIEKGLNFVLNLHGFIGYFKGLKEVPYELTIGKPANLTATTSLSRKAGEEAATTQDVFEAKRYFGIIDNPIMYNERNSVSFDVNNIKVNLSIYSPNGAYKATDLKERMEEMMRAQKTFLGAVDGTKEYSILLYLSQMGDTDAMGFGALEHHTSTVVVLPEAMPQDRLEQAMVDVVSHEFFHIVTPLNVHSKEVQYFDYNNPKMSQHLWMYEGTTEYFANLFQIDQELIDAAEFYERIMGKINNSKGYDDAMSFTQMSTNVLDEPYKENYANVYEKGALINMCLDIILREQSQGEKGVLWMMQQLSNKYGKNVPFEDADLMDEIVAMTYPEVRSFFDAHVIGDTPIDYETFFAKVGLGITESEKQTGYFLDGDMPFIDVDQKNNNAIYVRKGIDLNTFFTDLGLQGGDVIKKINGTDIDLEAIRGVIGQSFGWTPDTDITMVVERDGQEMEISGKVGTPMAKEKILAPLDSATAAQNQLREAWMKG